ncbi:hypothetical protein [Lacticaseibacillus porcinae]|uniref:hypothetical protein n=1 Tax=Lacticaseibacillus porcinae TaxID=1123687 RepID=UPI000F79D14E|nr:hypothetical protein [Lacticaseibacillus porcinae]
MSIFKYLGNTIQIMILSAVIITVYAITPDGKIVYVLSPFFIYMLISTFFSGPFMMPKLKHLTHHWFLSAKAKRNYFHFRETVHQSPYLFDPVKFYAEPQDIGKSEELQNLSGYIVLLLIISLFSPLLFGLWVVIKGLQQLRAN